MPFLPLILTPWLIWPPVVTAVWGALRGNHSLPPAQESESGTRLLITVVFASLLILSLISGKRLHYLIPVFPALAILLAWAISAARYASIEPSIKFVLPTSIVSVCVGLLVLISPELGFLFGVEEWTVGLSRWWGMTLIVAVGLLVVGARRGIYTQIMGIAGITVVLVGMVHGIASSRLSDAYDLRPLAQQLSNFQKDGYRIANFGKYHGQFNFLGRLAVTIEETGSGEVVEWIKNNPRSKIISTHYSIKEGLEPEIVLPFRGRYIAVWDAAKVTADPTIVRRGNR